MEEIIKYFGADWIGYILAENTAIRFANAKSGAWMCNDMESYRMYIEFGKLIGAEL